ncbi:MAG: hypothetical protein U5R06_11035 [candidate division KSB1 bacterium]|nr:hypothetical protein [candidate division KSB1 bacterium]
MKKHFMLIAAVFVMFIACGDGESDAQKSTGLSDVKEKGSEFLQATQDYTVEQREEYEKALNEKIESMNAGIDSLKQQLDAANEKRRQELEKQITKLEKQVYDLKQSLEQLKQAGDGAWQGIKSGIDQTVKSIENAAKKLQTSDVK